jgi:N-acetyl-alpha-D-muramate 1-phosphate uridylyltransferase
MRAMILAAGQGTRLRPLTDHIPKPLVRFKGTPLLEIIIKRLLNTGMEKIIVNVHHMAEQVVEFLKLRDYYHGNVLVSDETNRLMDTGGGVLKASELLNNGEPFLVHNVDVFTNLDITKLIQTHQTDDALITIAVKKRVTSRSLLFDKQNQLTGWQHNQTGEKKIIRDFSGDLTEYGNSCVYIINPEFFRLVQTREPVSLTDIYLDLAKKHTIKGYIHNQDYWYNLGLYDAFLKAEADVENSEITGLEDPAKVLE